LLGLCIGVGYPADAMTHNEIVRAEFTRQARSFANSEVLAADEITEAIAVALRSRDGI
jgi:hypothetical protein